MMSSHSKADIEKYLDGLRHQLPQVDRNICLEELKYLNSNEQDELILHLPSFTLKARCRIIFKWLHSSTDDDDFNPPDHYLNTSRLERKRNAVAAELSECPGVSQSDKLEVVERSADVPESKECPGSSQSDTLDIAERTPTPTKFSVFIKEQYELSPNILIPSNESMKNMCSRAGTRFPSYAGKVTCGYGVKEFKSPKSRFYLKYKELPSTPGVFKFSCTTEVDRETVVVSYIIRLEIFKDWNYSRIYQMFMFGYEDPNNQILLGKQALALLCDWAMEKYSSEFGKPFYGFQFLCGVDDYSYSFDFMLKIGFREPSNQDYWGGLMFENT